MYSFFGFFTFNREQYAVLNGRHRYYKNLKNNNSRSRVYLRRNIHRIEKGMLMKPKRDIFALDYIGETVDFFCEAATSYKEKNNSVDKDEVAWAQDVLTEYFKTIKGNDTTDKLKEIFLEKKIDFKAHATSDVKVPYARKDSPDIDISYKQMLELSMRRRSVRWFEDKKVPRGLIDKAILVARQSPTACNRMPYEFRIFDDPEMVKKVSGLPFGAAGYADNIPTIIVVVGKLDSYFSPRDRHAIYIDASLAAMSFLFAVETLGLGASIINWPDFEPLEMKMQKTLGLADYERAIMLIAVGFPDPDAKVAYSQKKELETMRSYNLMSKDAE